MASSLARTFLITGGASGLGEACARVFVSRGHNVTLIDRNGEMAKKLQGELGEDKCHVAVADITSEGTSSRCARRRENWRENGRVSPCFPRKARRLC